MNARRAAAAAIAAALLASGSFLAQQGDRAPIDTAPPPAEWAIPPSPVRSPEASIGLMDLPPGFRVEVVAAEPLVQDPIAFAFGADGRLWVLEWPSYNWELRAMLPGLDAQESPPPSRVVVLRDANRDGRMDERTVFAEIDWPRGLQPVDDGVLVFALPDVVFLRDRNGDGRADSREVIDSGLPIPANPHAAPSSPAWTIDNWIYGLQTTRRLRYGAGRWRVEESARLGGQWGLSQDDAGRLFFGYNGDHLRGSLLPVHYAVRNPHYPATAGTDVRIGTDQTVWPHGLTASVNRRAQLGDDGRLRVFTANAGPSVYRGDNFPADFQGNVFVAEAAGRLIRRVVLADDQGTVTGRNAYPDREFLFSRDERFRPVFTAGGPDGALYVADMYRGIIEGHIFVTSFLRHQIVDRTLQRPFHGMGRLYRIVHDRRPRPVTPAGGPREPRDWLPFLAHANGFWRDAAQRAIVAAGDVSLVDALGRLATSAPGALTRLHALWTLEGLNAVSPEIVHALVSDESPQVRSAVVRVAEPALDDPRVLQVVTTLMNDPHLIVRRQLLLSLGTSDRPEAEQAMLAMLDRDAGEPFMIAAALSGLAEREAEVLERILARDDWTSERSGAPALVAALSTAVTTEGRLERIDALISRAVDAAQPTWRRRAILQGMVSSTRRQFSAPPSSVHLLGGRATGELGDLARTMLARFTAVAAVPDVPGATVARGGAAGARIEQGRALFAVCAGCHQADGRGLPALAPSLHGAPRVTGAPEVLIDIVLRGRDEDPAYPSMSPLPGLSDDQLAAILTYIRQAWGHAASPISADEVGRRRGAREQPE